MENQPKLNSNKEVIAFLAERFPLCFTTEGEARPLKIGVFQDLVKRVHGKDNISKTQLRSALRIYTSSWRYLYGIKVGVQRVDLDGNPCGELEKQHIEHARKQLEEAKARIQFQRTVQQTKKRENFEVVVQRRPIMTKQSTKSNTVTPREPSSKQERLAFTSKQSVPVIKVASVTDIFMLQIGQAIKVKMGKITIDATVMKIVKEGVRVQLSSGMALIVRAEHLQL